jgi:hypothetical protein
MMQKTGVTVLLLKWRYPRTLWKIKINSIELRLYCMEQNIGLLKMICLTNKRNQDVYATMYLWPHKISRS